MQVHTYILTVLLWLSSFILSAQNQSTYHILSRERESLQCRWDLIQQAKAEILLSTYSIKDDAIGLGTLQLLIQAAERGVSVQLLVDDFDNGLPSCLLTYLEERGVRTKVFNILNPFKFRTLVDRMHGKMLIIDQKTLIVGGRNLTEKYFMLDSTSNFLDREVHVVSDSTARHARLHFRELWNNPKLSGRKHHKPNKAQRICWQNTLEEALAQVQQRLHLAPIGQKNWNTGFKNTTQTVHFIHDNYTYFQKRKGRRWRARKDRQATDELIALVAKADSTLFLENPYFIPTRRWRRAIKSSIDRGVKIRLITNSSYTSDLPVVQAVYRNRRARALRAGVEIWEYRGTKMLHTKAMVIDGQVSAIGSYNLELLSHKFNAEVMVWVNDPFLAAEHSVHMENVLKRSVRVGVKPNGPRKKMPPPSKLQRKRHRKVQIMRFTFAPFLGIIL